MTHFAPSEHPHSFTLELSFNSHSLDISLGRPGTRRTRSKCLMFLTFRTALKFAAPRTIRILGKWLAAPMAIPRIERFAFPGILVNPIARRTHSLARVANRLQPDQRNTLKTPSYSGLVQGERTLNTARPSTCGRFRIYFVGGERGRMHRFPKAFHLCLARHPERLPQLRYRWPRVRSQILRPPEGVTVVGPSRTCRRRNASNTHALCRTSSVGTGLPMNKSLTRRCS